MCTNYTPSSRDRLQAARLGVMHLPPQDWPPEAYPLYKAPLVLGLTSAAGPLAREVVVAQFGLSPRWSQDAAHATRLARHMVNARSETVASKPSFRAPWRQRQWALVPMDNFYEPCWESGAGVRWRFSAADGNLLTAAALWERWLRPQDGVVVTSFSLLTINADSHPLMRRMHRPGEEKRMLALVPAALRDDWLSATNDEAYALLQPMPADQLVASAAPRPARPQSPLVSSDTATSEPSAHSKLVSDTSQNAPIAIVPHNLRLF